MPNYVFRCTCDVEHSASFPIAEVPEKDICPACGSDAIRVIRWNGTSVLRGKGWARHSDRDVANFKRGPQ